MADLVATLRLNGVGVTKDAPVWLPVVADSEADTSVMLKDDPGWSPRTAPVALNVTVPGVAMRTDCETVDGA